MLRKKDFLVIPFAIGERFCDYTDIESLGGSISIPNCYGLKFLPTFNTKRKYKEIAADATQVLLSILKRETGPKAIFLILNHDFAEQAKRVIDLENQIKLANQDVRIYTVIWDEGYMGAKRPNKYLIKSGRASYLFLNSDAPSNGALRVAEFIKRVMGFDLLPEKFPDYSPETVSKIAKHINKENFNFFGVRKGSIPKYPIKDGLPYFPVLEVKLNCPICSTPVVVCRQKIELDGSAEVFCFGNGSTHKAAFKGLEPEYFDPWPEFYEHKKKWA